ncbi:MAG: hypothetical protein LBE24_10410 [Methylobacillus sp.]|jgi:hypothetical protein|nr:hypothetical protein [Methylobacillus sp.]
MKRVLLLMLLFAALPVHAAGNNDCSGLTFSEARSLADLPREVVALLSNGNRKYLADSNEPFQLTDAGGPEDYPSSRFNLAAVNRERIFAVIEHGGVMHWFELWSLTRGWTGWRVAQKNRIEEIPGTAKALTAQACK